MPSSMAPVTNTRIARRLMKIVIVKGFMETVGSTLGRVPKSEG